MELAAETLIPWWGVEMRPRLWGQADFRGWAALSISSTLFRECRTGGLFPAPASRPAGFEDLQCESRLGRAFRSSSTSLPPALRPFSESGDRAQGGQVAPGPHLPGCGAEAEACLGSSHLALRAALFISPPLTFHILYVPLSSRILLSQSSLRKRRRGFGKGVCA